MRINFLAPGINFGKTFINKTAVRKTDGSKTELNFVEYDCDNKKDCAKIKQTQRLWGPEAANMDLIAKPFHHSRKTQAAVPWQHIYGLENESGDILVLAKIREEDDKKNGKYVSISSIQADPDEMWNSTYKKHKNLGEALVCQIVKLAKKNGAGNISLKSENEGFWARNKYFRLAEIQASRRPVRELIQTNYDDYIDYVENKL